jgi:hypothetical protein
MPLTHYHYLVRQVAHQKEFSRGPATPEPRLRSFSDSLFDSHKDTKTQRFRNPIP